MKPGDAEWLKQQIKACSNEQKHYEAYAAKLREILESARDRFAPEGVVAARPKSLSSFAEKALRKKDKYADPIHQITDLAGARVVVLTEEEAERLCAFIRAHFLIDEANTLNCAERLAAREFGYRGVHFVVQIIPGKTPILGVNVPDDFGGRKAEIQVHTALQNAWAAVGHDRMYKSPFPVPAKFERDGARVAAMLEVSDRDFGQLIDGLDRYAMNHGVALSPEDLLRELVDLSVLRATDRDKTSRVGHALRQAQLAKVLYAWDLVILFLEEVDFNGLPGFLADRVRFELGQAYCRTSVPRHTRYGIGRDLLAEVARPDKPPDPPGHVSRRANELRARAAVALARCAREGPACAHKPADLYRLAMQCEPANPYHLSAFLEYEMERLKHAEYVELMRPGLLAAIQTCRDHADVQIELPQPFFTAGRFCLVLQQPNYEALAEYAKGVQVCLDPEKCVAPEALGEEIRFYDTFEEVLPAEAACMKRLLVVAQALKADPEHACAACVDAFAALAGLQASKAAKKWAEPLREVLASIETETNDRWVSWPKGIGRLATARRSRFKPAAKALRPLASKRRPSLKEPVLIVAGGADQSVEHRMREYRDHLLQALLAFEGTLCSGATEQGIPGLVGDVVRESRDRGNNGQHLIGYLPQPPLPKDATEDERYDERIRTSGKGLTPMEPLQNWIDILVAGLEPAEVRLLGINGGSIAASEYRMALGLGASVAVVESSGRAVAELLPDVHWWQARNLLVLPSDRMAVRAFVMMGRVPPVLAGAKLEEAAKAVHETFLAEKRYQKGDESVMPWDYLRDDLQKSNREQVAYWIQLLQAADCDVRPAARPLDAKPFGDDQVNIELMAEMEHGRWLVERLRSGWRYGPRRDPKEKTSPHLVPWDEVGEKTREWDRDAARNIPVYLAKAGLEVFYTGSRRATGDTCSKKPRGGKKK